MKKTDSNQKTEMKTEYDFATMKGGVRAKYVKRLREQTNAISPKVANKRSRGRLRSTSNS
jgi:hypothetical protein